MTTPAKFQDARAAFKLLYARARAIQKREAPAGTHPYMIADRALDAATRLLDHDWRTYLDERTDGPGRRWSVFNAVNLAIAWSTGWDMPERPATGSIVRVNFELGPEGSRVWFPGPRLPG